MAREIVERRTLLPPELENIRHSLGRAQDDPCTRALQQCIGGDRRPVNDPADLRRGRPEGVERRHDALALVTRSAQNLARLDASRCLDRDEVGEGAADVNSDR